MTSVKFPPKAAVALGFLKAHNNDIEIFVEDRSSPNLWLFLLRHYLPDGIRLNSVNVLGSRDEVIRACRADQENDGRRKLYIIDGDMDVLRGRPRPRLRHLYRLRSYCVENYLLDERAIISAVMVLNPRVDEASVQNRLDYSGWFDRNRALLLYLFVCYGVTYELNREVQTVRFSVHRLFRANDPMVNLSRRKVVGRVLSLFRAVRRRRSKEETRMVFDRIRANAEKLGLERVVSGKDYIFPSLYGITKGHFGVNLRSDSFRVLVAQFATRTLDPYLLRRLRKICLY